MAQPKPLTRSATNQALTGTLAGMAEYINIDPVVLRLVYVALTAFTGFVPGIAAYVIMVLIVPEPSAAPKSKTRSTKKIA